jgi:hypothetical protein
MHNMTGLNVLLGYSISITGAGHWINAAPGYRTAQVERAEV